MHLICTSVKRQPGRWDKLKLGFISLRFVERALEGTGLRSRTHGNVFLHFCIVPSNELVVLDSLENSKQYKNAGNVSVCTGTKCVSANPNAPYAEHAALFTRLAR